MMDCEPSAAILLKNSRTSSLDELKTYENNTIYLDNGNEFQIRLFNPTTFKLGVQIGLNGNFSHSYLVLRPGEDITLDRFIDDQRKMLFETYSIDSSNKDAQKAIANNGVLEINFFKEKIQQAVYFSTFSSINLNSRDTYSGGFAHTTNSNPDSLKLFDTSIDYSADLDKFEQSQTLSASTLGMKRSKSTLKETGRIEKGNVSEQNFNKVEVKFDEFPYYGIIFNLKPNSEKVYSNTSTRNYCQNCGYRLRDKAWLYCPKCSKSIQ
jgi:hypothetical protein